MNKTISSFSDLDIWHKRILVINIHDAKTAKKSTFKQHLSKICMMFFTCFIGQNIQRVLIFATYITSILKTCKTNIIYLLLGPKNFIFYQKMQRSLFLNLYSLQILMAVLQDVWCIILQSGARKASFLLSFYCSFPTSPFFITEGNYVVHLTHVKQDGHDHNVLPTVQKRSNILTLDCRHESTYKNPVYFECIYCTKLVPTW